MINTTDLIERFQYALDQKWGYILGTSGGIWTQSDQNSTKNEQAQKYGSKWIGKHVADCSGLFVWAFKQLGGSIYHGSNTIWNKYLSAKGTLKSGKRDDGKPLQPGTAVFKTNGDDRYHIGLFIGNGIVIEAKGTYYGVVTSNVSAWSEWGELKDVSYEEPAPDPVIPEGKAIVNATAVALREAPSKSGKVITRVSKSTVVELDRLPDDWTYIKVNGQRGFMMSEFLTKGGQK